VTDPAATSREPLLGEWACLGILYGQPAHGWAIATQLLPDGEIGRVWHLSRPLTYRAIDHLSELGWVEPVGEERGDAGPSRTILSATRSGRSRFRRWLRTPVVHLRDLRSELLLKLVFAERYAVDIGEMLDRQRSIIDRQARSLVDAGANDVVTLWRLEATLAAQRFLARVVEE
jgi:DNA-binding PadR family transcriptional regulator